MNNIQDICDWNNKAGNTREYRDLKSEEVLENLSFVLEEVKEMKDAFGDNDRREVVDGLFDTIFTAVGTLHRMGYDPDEVIRIGNESNQTKFIDLDDTDGIKATLQKYDSDDRYTDVHMVIVDGVGVFKGTVVETGKLKTLKSIHFQEPEWDLLDPNL